MEIHSEILCDFTHQLLKRQEWDQKIHTLLEMANFMHGYESIRPVGLLRLFLSWSLGSYLSIGYLAGSRCLPGHRYGLLHHVSCMFSMQDLRFGFDFGLGLLLQLCLGLGVFVLDMPVESIFILIYLTCFPFPLVFPHLNGTKSGLPRIIFSSLISKSGILV